MPKLPQTFRNLVQNYRRFNFDLPKFVTIIREHPLKLLKFFEQFLEFLLEFSQNFIVIFS